MQGGYCDVGDDELLDGQPFHGGYCVCDSIRNGRFKHPSATGYESKAYDYYFQGWAGAQGLVGGEMLALEGVLTSLFNFLVRELVVAFVLVVVVLK